MSTKANKVNYNNPKEVAKPNYKERKVLVSYAENQEIMHLIVEKQQER